MLDKYLWFSIALGPVFSSLAIQPQMRLKILHKLRMKNNCCPKRPKNKKIMACGESKAVRRVRNQIIMEGIVGLEVVPENFRCTTYFRKNCFYHLLFSFTSKLHNAYGAVFDHIGL